MYTHLHTYIWPLSGVCIARNRKPERWGHPRGLMFARDSTWEILCARQSAGERHAYTYTHIIYIHLQGTCKCTLPFSTLPCHPPPRCSQNLAHTKTHTNTHIVRFCLLRVWCACCMLMRICMSTFVCFCVVCAFICVVCLHSLPKTRRCSSGILKPSSPCRKAEPTTNANLPKTEVMLVW